MSAEVEWKKGEVSPREIRGKETFYEDRWIQMQMCSQKACKMPLSKHYDKDFQFIFLRERDFLRLPSPRGKFPVLLNKISQLWFMFCIYHFVDFVQKHYYYLNYPNKTINFFYWLVLWDSFIFNGFLSHFSCLNAFLFVSCNSGFTGCSVAFSSADGFPSAHHHAVEHTLPFPLSWRFS